MGSRANCAIRLPISRPVSRRLRLVVAALLLIGSGPVSAPHTSVPESVVECVPCHHGGEMDQVGEWLASPYSATEGGLDCLDCHRAPCRERGGTDRVHRESSTTGSENLRSAARLTVTAVRDGDVVEAEVAVTNVGVGHLLPTGSARRRLVLEIAAHDSGNAPLRLRAGPKLAPHAGDAPVIAGRIFARDPSPNSPPARDARLAPFETDVSRYLFAAPEGEPIRVTARLVLAPVGGKPVEIANTATMCRGAGPRTALSDGHAERGSR